MLPRGAGHLLISRVAVRIAEVGQDGSLLRPVARFLKEAKRTAVARCRRSVIAELVPDNAEMMPRIRLAKRVAQFMLQIE